MLKPRVLKTSITSFITRGITASSLHCAAAYFVVKATQQKIYTSENLAETRYNKHSSHQLNQDTISY